MRWSTIPSMSLGSSGGRRSRARSARGLPSAIFGRGLPVEDMIDVSDRTRPGAIAASTCAIIPPIETPTTWARSAPAASSTPTASRAMSRSSYGADTFRRSSARKIARGMFGTGRSRRRDEPPQSRLSNVITRNPRSTSVAMNSSGHIAAGMPRPMISSRGWACSAPRTSYSSRSPLTSVYGIEPVAYLDVLADEATLSSSTSNSRTWLASGPWSP